MAHLVPVGQLDEIPPGKGKTLLAEGREITVYNQEGRLIATATLVRHLAGAPETTCTQPGHRFDLGMADSPDRLKSDELRYDVEIRDGFVFVLVEEGSPEPGKQPHHVRPRRRGR